MATWLHRYDHWVNRVQTGVAPLLLLVCRLWVAWVFFNAGLTKIATWDSTLYLFEYEYQVPFLPWLWAAYLATAAELSVPIFLALGLFTRPMAIMLFGFNIVAVASYPVLWEQGFYDHQLWGLMLLMVVIWGPGQLCADQWLRRKLA
ncbi:DoxX family protein [Vibrio sp. JPW-9-11-11]|uniref:DoxX family protein n=1 Tax=Vibrio sp. JPW-9-11-11 TaxID=1416532 RepID=UPI003F901C27